MHGVFLVGEARPLNEINCINATTMEGRDRLRSHIVLVYLSAVQRFLFKKQINFSVTVLLSSASD